MKRKPFRYFWQSIRDMHRFMPFLLWGKLTASIGEGILQVWQPVLIAEIFGLAPCLTDANRHIFRQKTIFLCICVGFPAVCSMILRAAGLYGEGRKDKSYGWNMFGFSRGIRLEALDDAKVLDCFQKADAAYSRHLAGSRMFSYLLMNVESVLVCISTFLVVGSFSPWLLPGVTVGFLFHLLIDIHAERKRTETYRGQSMKRRRLQYFWRLFCTKESVKEMRILGFHNYLKEKWVAANVDVVQEMEELELKAMKLSAAGVLVKNLCYVANVAIALLLMVKNELAAGQFAACLTAFGLLQDKLFMLDTFLISFLNSYHHVEEYYDFFETETDREGTETYQPFQREISLCDVRFRYPGAQSWALDGVNLTIRKGEHVVIVGVNGSGKTTLSRLLTGVYLADSGSVCYDGRNVTEIRRKGLYQDISAVIQDFVHYRFSLRENICVSDFRRKEDEEHIRNVTDAVGMQEMIQSIGGLDCELGSEFGGRELSGGEWQKVAIARGLFKDSGVLLLDEPTAALDPIAEYEILTGFLKLIQRRTSIIISHRVGICRHADKIIVMKGGKVAECGTHEELKNAGGEYARIWKAQAKWY